MRPAIEVATEAFAHWSGSRHTGSIVDLLVRVIEHVSPEAKREAYEDAARVVDEVNRTYPYTAIGAVKALRKRADEVCGAKK